MTKRDLVMEVAETLGFTQSDVAAVIETAFDKICTSLAEGKRLEIRNFGVFEVKVREARMGRNPQTGATIHIPAMTVPTFRAGKGLKDRVRV